MPPLAYFGIESHAFNLVMDLLIVFAVVVYVVADLLDLRGRAAADRGPDADRLRHGGVAVPVRGHARVHHPAPAGVPGGRAGARTGDAGGGSAPAPARPRPVPALRLSDRAGLHPLPELPAQAEGAVRELLQAAGPGVDDLPVLRDGRAPGGDSAPPHALGAGSQRADDAGGERGADGGHLRGWPHRGAAAPEPASGRRVLAGRPRFERSLPRPSTGRTEDLI